MAAMPDCRWCRAGIGVYPWSVIRRGGVIREIVICFREFDMNAKEQDHPLNGPHPTDIR